MKNFHLPLPEEVYAALREQASALSRPATVIAREAIEAWLRDRQRASVREAIAEYAAKHAGTTAPNADAGKKRRGAADGRAKQRGGLEAHAAGGLDRQTDQRAARENQRQVQVETDEDVVGDVHHAGGAR